ncbi:MAG: hypothetical protein [Siphoviridae sp. ctvD11]|nr:MAG: hypothetical protein [Siphoviridae sp. ctvD11]
MYYDVDKLYAAVVEFSVALPSSDSMRSTTSIANDGVVPAMVATARTNLYGARSTLPAAILLSLVPVKVPKVSLAVYVPPTVSEVSMVTIQVSSDVSAAPKFTMARASPEYFSMSTPVPVTVEVATCGRMRLMTL